LERLREFNAELLQESAAHTLLLERQADQLRLLAHQLTDAEHRERKRIAELIHDHLQQLLIAAKMRVNRIGRGESPEEQSAAAADAEHLIQQAMDMARSLTSELRPPVLYVKGFVEAIHWLGEHTKLQYDVEVATKLDPGSEPAEERMKVFLYQAVRELIFNAVKHANTRAVRVTAAVFKPGTLRISVEDEGMGFDPSVIKEKQATNEGLGLFTIEERMTALGGNMRIESRPSAGTRVHLELPLNISHDIVKPGEMQYGQEDGFTTIKNRGGAFMDMDNIG